MGKRKIKVEYYEAKKPCNKCGGLLRYRSNRNCPVCNLMKERRPKVAIDVESDPRAYKDNPRYDPFVSWVEASRRAGQPNLMQYLEELSSDV